MVSKNSDTSVKVEAVDDDFENQDIIISGVEPDSSLSDTPKFMEAGAAIGTAKTSNCQPNSIHLAVRKRGGDDDDVIDPSRFLKTSKPAPGWIQECNDRKFYRISLTSIPAFDVGAILDAVAKAVQKAITRAIDTAVNIFLDWIKNAGIPTFLLDLDLGFDANFFGNGIRSSLKNFGNIKNLFGSVNNVLGSFG
jgi:hypothetical protein